MQLQFSFILIFYGILQFLPFVFFYAKLRETNAKLMLKLKTVLSYSGLVFVTYLAKNELNMKETEKRMWGLNPL